MSKKILVIGDTQCKPDVDLAYMSHIGQYIVDKRPDVIVHIGDHFDFQSLSSYDKGKRSAEGRRLILDLEAGHEGMERLMKPMQTLQGQQKRFRKKVYNPEMVFCVGNHEDRFDRMAKDDPALEGFVGTETLNLEQYGWEVSPYLKPHVIQGIHFVHFLANPFTGKPYGGTALNQLKNVGTSFVVGHKQVLDIAMVPTLDGGMRLGLINGACYEHDEEYKGYQGNNHFRGLVMLHEAADGFALPMPVSLKYLKERYS